jgi:hypothetical protein
VSAPLRVIEQRYPFTIGINLFRRLELGITGLPNPAEPESDNRESLICDITPDEEKQHNSKKKTYIF